jgi:tetratricopeptide (TPR) repeat protein
MNTTSSGTDKYSKYFLPAIILILFILYSQSFFSKFVFLDDDAIVLEGYSRINSVEKILPAFSGNYLEGHYYRPLTNISFIANALVSGKSPWAYHAGNILLHALTVIILFYLLIKLGYSKTTIAPVLLLFAVSPLQLNAVGWIAGRADLLIGFFSLGGFLLFLKYRENPRLHYIIPVSLLLLCAFFSKESALLMPFLIFLYYFTGGKTPGTGAKHFLFFAFLSALLAFYFQFRFMFTESIASEKIVFSNLAATILIIPETAVKFFLPFGIRVLPDFTPFLSGAGIVLILFLLTLPFIKKKINKKNYFFGFTWFIVLMIPGLFFKPNLFDKFYYWDCRSYLPSVGLVIMLSEIISALFTNKISMRILKILGIYFALLFICSSYYLLLYNNPLTFWSSVEKEYPERFLPHVALYKYYTYTNNPDEAEFHFVKAIELSPENRSNREKLFDYYIAGNQPEKAFQTAIDGLKYDPDEESLIRGIITSAVLMQKVELLDPYLFDTTRTPEMNRRLRTILSEELEPLKKFISNSLYDKLQKRIIRLGEAAPEIKLK